MTYTEVLQAAKGQMGFCHACPVCNGRACGGTIPGPGAKGSGTVAIRNFDAWRNVRLNMDTIHENFEPDTSLELFGRKFKYPFFAPPLAAMAAVAPSMTLGFVPSPVNAAMPAAAQAATKISLYCKSLYLSP